MYYYSKVVIIPPQSEKSFYAAVTGLEMGIVFL